MFIKMIKLTLKRGKRTETVTVLKNEGRLLTRSVALGKEKEAAGGVTENWAVSWKVRFGQIIG